MAHRVVNIENLHADALTLYNSYVIGGEASADSILNDLNMAIENLKTNWKGADAGIRIQEIILVHNSMVAVRNALAELARASAAVAYDYRERQIANGANVGSLTTLNYDARTVLGEYVDTTDQVYIQADANVGKQKIDAANANLDTFRLNVESKYNAIMDNWQEGTGRDTAVEAFTSFINNVGAYKEKLTNASSNITLALQNYGL